MSDTADSRGGRRHVGPKRRSLGCRVSTISPVFGSQYLADDESFVMVNDDEGSDPSMDWCSGALPLCHRRPPSSTSKPVVRGSGPSSDGARTVDPSAVEGMEGDTRTIVGMLETSLETGPLHGNGSKTVSNGEPVRHSGQVGRDLVDGDPDGESDWGLSIGLSRTGICGCGIGWSGSLSWARVVRPGPSQPHQARFSPGLSVRALSFPRVVDAGV